MSTGDHTENNCCAGTGYVSTPNTTWEPNYCPDSNWYWYWGPCYRPCPCWPVIADPDKGWECPKCHRVFSPKVEECKYCGKPTVTWTSVGSNATTDTCKSNVTVTYE